MRVREHTSYRPGDRVRPRVEACDECFADAKERMLIGGVRAGYCIIFPQNFFLDIAGISGVVVSSIPMRETQGGGASK